MMSAHLNSMNNSQSESDYIIGTANGKEVWFCCKKRYFYQMIEGKPQRVFAAGITWQSPNIEKDFLSDKELMDKDLKEMKEWKDKMKGDLSQWASNKGRIGEQYQRNAKIPRTQNVAVNILNKLNITQDYAVGRPLKGKGVVYINVKDKVFYLMDNNKDQGEIREDQIWFDNRFLPYVPKLSTSRRYYRNRDQGHGRKYKNYNEYKALEGDNYRYKGKNRYNSLQEVDYQNKPNHEEKDYRNNQDKDLGPMYKPKAGKPNVNSRVARSRFNKGVNNYRRNDNSPIQKGYINEDGPYYGRWLDLTVDKEEYPHGQEGTFSSWAEFCQYYGEVPKGARIYDYNIIITGTRYVLRKTVGQYNEIKDQLAFYIPPGGWQMKLNPEMDKQRSKFFAWLNHPPVYRAEERRMRIQERLDAERENRRARGLRDLIIERNSRGEDFNPEILEEDEDNGTNKKSDAYGKENLRSDRQKEEIEKEVALKIANLQDRIKSITEEKNKKEKELLEEIKRLKEEKEQMAQEIKQLKRPKITEEQKIKIKGLLKNIIKNRKHQEHKCLRQRLYQWINIVKMIKNYIVRIYLRASRSMKSSIKKAVCREIFLNMVLQFCWYDPDSENNYIDCTSIKAPLVPPSLRRWLRYEDRYRRKFAVKVSINWNISKFYAEALKHIAECMVLWSLPSKVQHEIWKKYDLPENRQNIDSEIGFNENEIQKKYQVSIGPKYEATLRYVRQKFDIQSNKLKLKVKEKNHPFDESVQDIEKQLKEMKDKDEKLDETEDAKNVLDITQTLANGTEYSKVTLKELSFDGQHDGEYNSFDDDMDDKGHLSESYYEKEALEKEKEQKERLERIERKHKEKIEKRKREKELSKKSEMPFRPEEEKYRFEKKIVVQEVESKTQQELEKEQYDILGIKQEEEESEAHEKLESQNISIHNEEEENEDDDKDGEMVSKKTMEKIAKAEELSKTKPWIKEDEKVANPPKYKASKEQESIGQTPLGNEIFNLQSGTKSIDETFNNKMKNVPIGKAKEEEISTEIDKHYKNLLFGNNKKKKKDGFNSNNQSKLEQNKQFQNKMKKFNEENYQKQKENREKQKILDMKKEAIMKHKKGKNYKPDIFKHSKKGGKTWYTKVQLPQKPSVYTFERDETPYYQ